MQIFEYILTFSGLYVPTPSEVEGKGRGYMWDNRLVPIAGAYEHDVLPLRYAKRPTVLCRNCYHMHRVPSPEDLLQLFCVSKRMYAEAKPVFFGQNHFLVHHIAGLNHFVDSLPADRLEHVARLTMVYDASTTGFEVAEPPETVDQLLRKGKGLKSITLEARDSDWSTFSYEHVLFGGSEASLAGIEELCNLLAAVEHAEIVCDCRSIRDYIQRRLVEIRQEEAKAKEAE